MHFLHKIGVIFLLFVAFLGSLGWFLSPQDELEKVDVIIAVSGDEGRRFETARRLYTEGYADRIIFSGAASDPSSPSNASVGRRLAIEAGIPSIHIITEDASRSTRENARNVARIIEEKGYESVILITSPYHQRRAYLEFSWATPDDMQILNHSVKDDEDWRRSQWWITPSGWYLTLSEGVKTSLTSLQHWFGSDPQSTT